jgi:hypothetical protein
LETLAQTWSEHCAHKTFRAAIRDGDGAAITPLFSQLRAATNAIAAPWVVSAFVGNAGIIDFTPEHTLAVKVETHNHPSAIEPFGGANTGVGGGSVTCSARPPPIAVTDVLCFDRSTSIRLRPTACCTLDASAPASSPASPTTATRSACRRSPAPFCTTPGSRPTRSCSAAASAWRAATPRPPWDRSPTTAWW